MGFRVGIIGAGAMSARMADTIRQMKEADLYAVAARDEKRAADFAKKYDAEKSYGSYEALMEDPDVELIYLALPNHLHYEVARDCIKHGKPVLLEKPFALNEKQAQALIDIAELNGVFLCEAMWVRFMPLLLRLKKEIEDGRIGEVLSLSADIGYDLKEKERVTDLKLGGGALLDIGVYPLIFAITILGGEIDNISTSMIRMNTGVDAQETITLSYVNGALADLFVTMLTNTKKAAVIYGSNGRIEVEDINQFIQYTVYDADGKPVETVERPETISGLEYEVSACIHAIRNERLECKEMSHADTLFLMRVLTSVRNIWGMRFPQEEQV